MCPIRQETQIYIYRFLNLKYALTKHNVINNIINDDNINSQHSYSQKRHEKPLKCFMKVELSVPVFEDLKATVSVTFSLLNY